MKRSALRSLLTVLLLPLAAHAQNPATATTLTSSSPTLQLPGSLTLTATVAPPRATAGMPSGNVAFTLNGVSIGSAPLTAIPSTESFSSAATTANVGYEPFGLFTLNSATANYSAVGVLDWYYPSDSEFAEPEVIVYSGKGANLFQPSTSAAYRITNSGIIGSYPGVDAYALADFNHDGNPDLLLHGYTGNGDQYYMLPGTAGGGFDQTNAVLSPDNSGISCDCSNPTEVMTVDDFNGDGYPDVAYAANGSYNNARVGVTLNAGASAPGSFATFQAAPAIVPTVSGYTFNPRAIASGHLTSSGHADLVVVGYFFDTDGAEVFPGNVAVYLGHGDGTFGTPTLFTAGDNPGAVATGDFRNNGMTDVVVSNEGEPTDAVSIEVMFGDGTGNLTASSTVTVPVAMSSIIVKDLNNDGFQDILATGIDGSVNILLNDGTGHFSTVTTIPNTSVGVSSLTAVGDFNADGLADAVEISLNPLTDTTPDSTASELLNSASSQAILNTAAKTVGAGTDVLKAAFPGDNNFSLSAGEITVAVTQTPSTLAWAPPAAMEYGTPLGPSQLDATASVPGAFTYSPAAGTVLPPGSTKVTANFAPTDSFDYSVASTSQTVTVASPALTGISPSTAKLGDASATISIAGQGFIQGAVAEWNGTALATSWVSLNQLTAVIPGSLLTGAGTGTITVAEPNKLAISGAETFTILASNAVAQASAPTTALAGQDSSVTLTVSPYPVAITATLSLSFTPAPPNTATDPAVLFPNNTTTDVIQIPANSSTPIPAIDFSPGSTAGTITVAVQLTAGGTNITPASLVPVTIAVPASAPVINSVTLTRSGQSMTVAILGLSSTRDMTQAHFHFTPAAGQSLKTTDVTIDLSGPFSTWYGAANSAAYGTTFLYTQPFTLDSDASTVGSITVTLTNSQGDSQPSTAQ